MQFDIKARYSTAPNIGTRVLCFSCAVREAIEGKHIYVEIDDFSSDYDNRTLQCAICERYI